VKGILGWPRSGKGGCEAHVLHEVSEGRSFCNYATCNVARFSAEESGFGSHCSELLSRLCTDTIETGGQARIRSFGLASSNKPSVPFATS
jgi:hypothetical protein